VAAEKVKISVRWALAHAVSVSHAGGKTAGVTMGKEQAMRLVIVSLIIPYVCGAAEIPKGSHVLLKLVNSVTTRTAKEGDYVYMRTASPIVSGGQVVVPEGTYVQGVVWSSKQSGRVKGRAELGIRIENMTLASGTVVQVNPHLASVDAEDTGQKVHGENQIKQSGDKERDAARVATIAGGGAALGGLTDRSWKGAGIGAGVGSGVGLATVLLTRGREVTLRQGATLDVVFDRAVPVK
jgi:hypothetical protein